MWAGALFGPRPPIAGRRRLLSGKSLAFRSPSASVHPITAAVTGLRELGTCPRRFSLRLRRARSRRTIGEGGARLDVRHSEKRLRRRCAVLLPEVICTKTRPALSRTAESARGPTADRHRRTPATTFPILGALEAGRGRLIAPILVARASESRKRPRRPSQPGGRRTMTRRTASRGRKIGRAGARRSRARPHEGFAAYRRGHGGRHRRANRTSHGAAHEPCVRVDVPIIPSRCSSPTRRSTSIRRSPKARYRQNAIDLCHALGIAQPKSPFCRRWRPSNAKIKSTIDAAALCKMADRGQIVGAALDGRWRSTRGFQAGRRDQAYRFAGRRATPTCWSRRSRGRNMIAKATRLPRWRGRSRLVLGGASRSF